MAPVRSNLKSGRPPTARHKTVSLSKKATSRTISSFHQFNKALALADKNNEHETASRLRRQIADLGGLEKYQLASIQGQAVDRGGDSSIVLMDWLSHLKLESASTGAKLRMLEVGALSISNACSKSGIFDITRIDLNSQSLGILKQDFMARPLPTSERERFQIISLSLVLNFVPEPTARGDMLRRTCAFLGKERGGEEFFPSLFLVLPAACTTNSRFMSEERLTLIMTSLGYVLRQRKQTARLAYSLWTLRDEPECSTFRKDEVNPGRTRNNFCIVLKKEKRFEATPRTEESQKTHR